MKKIVVTLAVIMGLGMSQLSAQNVTGGIKADANLSNFALKDMGGVKSKMGFGATVGGFGRIGFGDNFALQPELLLHYKTSKMEAAGVDTDFQYFGLEVPIYAVGQTTIGNGKGFIGVGPYVGFGVDARYKKDGMQDVKLYKDDVLQPWDFGAGALLGYEFNNGLSINASYKIGFIDALDTGKDNASMLNQSISLGLGFRF